MKRKPAAESVEVSESLKKQKKSKTSKNPEELPKVSQDEENLLTAAALNNEIIKMRPVVDKAKRSLRMKLLRKIKEIRKSKKDGDSEKVKLKIKRLEEEIDALKPLDRDTVAKFALMNKKTLVQLNITDKTPTVERATYKLVYEKLLVEAVKAYRSKYDPWETTTAYLLQRFGKIAASKKEQAELLAAAAAAAAQGEGTSENDKKKITKKGESADIQKKSKIKIVEKQEEEGSEDLNVSDVSGGEEQLDEEEEMLDDEQLGDGDVQGEQEADVDDLDSDAGRGVSDVEMGTDSDEEQEREMIEKRRQLLLGIAGIEEKAERRQAVEKKKNEAKTASKQAIAKVLQKTLQEASTGLKSLKNQRKSQRASNIRQHFSKPPIDISKIKKPRLEIVDNQDAVVQRLGDLNSLQSGKRTTEEEADKPIKKKKSKKLKADNSSFLQSVLTTVDTEKNSEAVHPSWEAKRRQKEKLEQLKEAPKGKKIVFADDD